MNFTVFIIPQSDGAPSIQVRMQHMKVRTKYAMAHVVVGGSPRWPILFATSKKGKHYTTGGNSFGRKYLEYGYEIDKYVVPLHKLGLLSSDELLSCRAEVAVREKMIQRRQAAHRVAGDLKTAGVRMPVVLERKLHNILSTENT